MVVGRGEKVWCRSPPGGKKESLAAFLASVWSHMPLLRRREYPIPPPKKKHKKYLSIFPPCDPTKCHSGRLESDVNTK